MKTERNQLTSVGRLCIGFLSDAGAEKEVFQFARTHRDGIAMPLLAEETPSFPFHKSHFSHFQKIENLAGPFVRIKRVAKASPTSCNSLHMVTWVTGRLRALVLRCLVLNAIFSDGLDQTAPLAQ